MENAYGVALSVNPRQAAGQSQIEHRFKRGSRSHAQELSDLLLAQDLLFHRFYCG